MFSPVAAYLRQNGWSNWDVVQFKTGGGGTWIVFRPGARGPSFVAKFNNTPQSIEASYRELEILRFLAPFGRELGFPPVVFHAATARSFIFMQPAVLGKPLRDELSPCDERPLKRHFQIARDWLTRFQSLVAPEGYADAVFNRQITAAATPFIPEALVAAARQSAPSLAHIPAVAVHGDFWPRNILVASSAVSVIDWNTFHYGSPLEDLFTFAVGTVYRALPDPEESAALIWEVFFGSSPLGALTRGVAAHILHHWKVAPEFLRPLFLMALIARVSRTEFTDNAAWRVFLARLVAAGIPAPWAV